MVGSRTRRIGDSRLVWKAPLSAGGPANPIMYEAGDRQSLVLAPGGRDFMEPETSDRIIARALPHGGA